MAHKKRRNFRHVMEEDSGVLLRTKLPREWVLHEYAPDYGIDGTVEIFEPVGDDGESFETLGEHIFFQLKSIKKRNVTKKVAVQRYNPLLGKEFPPGRRNVGGKWAARFDAITYDMEVDELLTIEAMGASVAVVLFLVPLDENEVYIVSLTDYIDRVLNFDDPGWRNKGTKRIYIPVVNKVPTPPAMALLRQYGKRAKLMHLFNVSSYQCDAISDLLDNPEREVEALASQFCDRLLALDVWSENSWSILQFYHGILIGYRDLFAGDKAAINRIGWKYIENPDDLMLDLRTKIHFAWKGLRSLGPTYEDLVREWGLPTYNGMYNLSLGDLGPEYGDLVEYLSDYKE
ncbi:DUF4365 domain-containing protein [Streptomyces sp. NPDC091287]|uniref:DUF4365 domain-containing protein n=1 Tax=Streptomyces sp. NPDC091287 TaxID=3365988 RepID=UPI003807D4BF